MKVLKRQRYRKGLDIVISPLVVEIEEADLHKTTLVGLPVLTLRDVGKRCRFVLRDYPTYPRDGMWQIENDEQMAKRKEGS